MNSRRYFFRQLTSGLVAAAAAPGLFLPKLVKPTWKKTKRVQFEMLKGDTWEVLRLNSKGGTVEDFMHIQRLLIRKYLLDGELTIRRTFT